jgi:hypothetical protein
MCLSFQTLTPLNINPGFKVCVFKCNLRRYTAHKPEALATHKVRHQQRATAKMWRAQKKGEVQAGLPLTPGCQIGYMWLHGTYQLSSIERCFDAQ